MLTPNEIQFLIELLQQEILEMDELSVRGKKDYRGMAIELLWPILDELINKLWEILYYQDKTYIKRLLRLTKDQCDND